MKHIRFIVLLVLFQVSLNLNVCAQDIAASSVQYSNSELVETKERINYKKTDRLNAARCSSQEIVEDRNPDQKKTKKHKENKKGSARVSQVAGDVLLVVVEIIIDTLFSSLTGCYHN